jgi:RNA polymerase sigma factor (sigma-70 family)
MDSTQSLSDAEIVQALKNGGSMADKAILALYTHYYPYLQNFILNNSGNEQDAEDIFQETVVSFIELVKADKYRQEASIKTMLYTINRNIWYTEVTKRGNAKTRNKLYATDNILEDKNIDTYISEREARKELLQVITQLGSQCKEILSLDYYENLSMKEILEHTHFESEQVVRNKKYKCMKQLEQMIQDNPNLLTSLKNLLPYVH